MPIDPQTEQVIPMREVPKLTWLPHRRQGRRLAHSTLWRWSQRGIKGVRLETISVGGQRCTSVEALRRFFERLSFVAEEQEPSPRTAMNKVKKELDQLGL